MREFYKKSVLIRNDDHLEIQLSEIYDHMATLFPLTDEQKQQLITWECEEEIRSVIPLTDHIDMLKSYLAEGNDVVLISDMYLPKETIQKIAGPSVTIFDGGYGTAKELLRRLRVADLAQVDNTRKGSVTFLNSSDDPALIQRSKKLLNS